MAKLPPISRIIEEDFPSQKWIGKLLWPINRFMESVVGALNNSLTIGQNLSAQVKTVEFTTQPVIADTFPLKIKIETASRPTDVVMSRLSKADGANQTNAVSLDWELSETEIVIKFISGLDVSTSYVSRFLIFAE